MKLAVLVSGTGTLLEAMLQNELDISLVLADRPCRGLLIAQKKGIPTVMHKREFGSKFDRLNYSHEIVSILKRYSITLVAMAGFMTVLDKPVFDHYDGKILNTHPSLLPAFRGEHAVADTISYGAKISGCTIHIATLSLDDGPVLAQEAVQVYEGDSVASLQERIKRVERRLYPETIRKIIRNESQT